MNRSKGTEAPVTILLAVVIALVVIAAYFLILNPIPKNLESANKGAMEAACGGISFLTDDPNECTKKWIVDNYTQMKQTQPAGAFKNVIDTCNKTLSIAYNDEYKQKIVDTGNIANDVAIIDLCAEKCCRAKPKEQ
ncbi:MAG: hypothetical protein HZB68_05885 [Candidatus Aenigmarchaeota archaeon]|nr:hypothetical protein [Candidatus Aenigmarchaeota archaeon]